MLAGPVPPYSELAAANAELRALVAELGSRLEALASENAALRSENAELRALVAELGSRLEALASENAALRSENAELKRRLGMDSTNSSRPPSTDSPFDKPTPKSLRGKSGRKPGGQAGHPGQTLRQVADPDEVVVHEPSACRRCGRGLAGRPVCRVERRQQFDIPPVTVKVTEHRLVERECACGQRTCADAPAGVDAPVQYGPRIAAIVVYLYVGQFLSRTRTAAALAELFGTPMSEASVAAMTERAAGGLGGFLAHLRERISVADVAGFDETGLRVDSALHWVHCARTDKYTLITCHRRRGRDGIDDAGVLAGFTGVAVHDAWAPYDTYLDPDHQLCCAHALRELQAVTDAAPTGDWCWATQAADALVAIQRLVAAARAATAGRDPAALAAQTQLYRCAAQIGANQTAARTDKLMKKHHALARRLLDRQDDYLRFTEDWRIPPDNNGSERDIRMIKLRQKVSGCLRTLAGAKQFCAIRSYLSTAAKHGHTSLDALVTLAEGRAWMPA